MVKQKRPGRVFTEKGFGALPKRMPTKAELGATMPDGAIYAGIDPETGDATYAIPRNLRRAARPKATPSSMISSGG